MFESAIDFFKEYRKKRSEALNNKSRMRWSTADISTLTELFNDKFGSDDENSEWEELMAKKEVDLLKLQAVRLKIAFLAGCRHDLRSQFAVGKNHDPKTGVDFDRHARNDALYAQYRLELLKIGIKNKEKGAKTI